MHILTRFAFLLLLLIYLPCRGQYRVVIAGNTGSLSAGKEETYYRALQQAITDSNTILVFTGNNGDTARLRGLARFVAGTPAKAYLLPGYDEWARGRRSGMQKVQTIQQFVSSLPGGKLEMMPGNGCPGPVTVKLGDKGILLLLDTQWWLQGHARPGLECGCPTRSREEVLDALEDLAMEYGNKLIVAATYHPVVNTGIHSGTFGLRQHIFPLTDIKGLRHAYIPLPLLGSIYPIIRSSLTSRQDANNRDHYRVMEEGIATLPGIHEAFHDHPRTVFISGQEASVQLLRDGHNYSIVSGAAVGGGRVRHTAYAPYVQAQSGFAVLDISANGIVTASIYKTDAPGAPACNRQLFTLDPGQQLFPDTAKLAMITADSVTAAVSATMGKANGIKNFFDGSNYRKEWLMSVKMRVFRMQQDYGGLRITGVGGGHQSISLHLEDATGRKWVLRQVNKNFDKVMPDGLRRTIFKNIVEDLASAQHPYGALGVPGLLAATGIPHASPQVVFVPNDTALGPYRSIFANTVCQLEERKPAINKNPLTGSFEMINTLAEDPRYSIDQGQYLEARLTDFLLADFDRHHGQWSWGWKDSNGRRLFYPVPKDRDQAFYNNNGWFVKVARLGPYGFMTNINDRIRSTKIMAAVGIPTDRYCLNELDQQAWQATLADFKTRLTDSVIDMSVAGMPPEVYAMKGERLAGLLKKRRDVIAVKGLEYYSYLGKIVDVPGDNTDNLFVVKQQDGADLLQVYGHDSSGRQVLRYTRLFRPGTTKEVRLYGLAGNDKFQLQGTNKLRWRLVGGSGADTFNIENGHHSWLYDQPMLGNVVQHRTRTSERWSQDPVEIAFPRKEHLGSQFQFPKVSAGYNEDDGVLLGAGAGFKTYSFGKRPYATAQSLMGMWAAQRTAWWLAYNGTFNELAGFADVVLHAEIANPTLHYFFGYGNETNYDKSKPITYYRARYDHLSADALIRRRFFNDSLASIAAGPSMYYYWNSSNPPAGKLLEQHTSPGLDSASVFSTKSYAGMKAVLTLNNIDNELLPGHGINWVTTFTAWKGVTPSALPYTSITSAADLYATLSRNAAVRVALHVGGGHIFSDQYEYFQAMTLGGSNYLRGFRRNRFTGNSMVYGSAELRLKLVSFNAYLIRGDFGLVGFNDVGRVWLKGERSDTWHHGYGGGLYVTPFNSCMLSAMMGCSNEDRLFYLTLGTGLSLFFGS